MPITSTFSHLNILINVFMFCCIVRSLLMMIAINHLLRIDLAAQRITPLCVSKQTT